MMCNAIYIMPMGIKKKQHRHRHVVTTGKNANRFLPYLSTTTPEKRKNLSGKLMSW